MMTTPGHHRAKSTGFDNDDGDDDDADDNGDDDAAAADDDDDDDDDDADDDDDEYTCLSTGLGHMCPNPQNGLFQCFESLFISKIF